MMERTKLTSAALRRDRRNEVRRQNLKERADEARLRVNERLSGTLDEMQEAKRKEQLIAADTRVEAQPQILSFPWMFDEKLVLALAALFHGVVWGIIQEGFVGTLGFLLAGTLTTGALFLMVRWAAASFLTKAEHYETIGTMQKISFFFFCGVFALVYGSLSALSSHLGGQVGPTISIAIGVGGGLLFMASSYMYSSFVLSHAERSAAYHHARDVRGRAVRRVEVHHQSLIDLKETDATDRRAAAERVAENYQQLGTSPVPKEPE